MEFLIIYSIKKKLTKQTRPRLKFHSREWHFDPSNLIFNLNLILNIRTFEYTMNKYRRNNYERRIEGEKWIQDGRISRMINEASNFFHLTSHHCIPFPSILLLPTTLHLLVNLIFSYPANLFFHHFLSSRKKLYFILCRSNVLIWYNRVKFPPVDIVDIAR